jgi:hypothetical protein
MTAFPPLFFVRPSVLLVGFVWALGAAATPIWIVLALALWAELSWTTRRLGLACGRPIPYVLCGVAGLGAVLAAPLRLVAGLIALWVWGTLVPVWMVNRARFQAMRAARRQAVVEQVIEQAETMTGWARAMAALRILRGAPVVPADPAKAGAVDGKVISMAGRRPA